MATKFNELKKGANVYIVRTANGIDIETDTLVNIDGTSYTLETPSGSKFNCNIPDNVCTAKANENYFVCADIESLMQVLNQ